MTKTTKRFLAILAVLMISFLFVGVVSASDGPAPVMDDEVVFFGTYTLESGERLDGSLIVFGGVVKLKEDSLVTGDVLVFGGNVTASGDIERGLVAIGGVVSLTETAVVQGDLIAPATVVRRDEGARIYGQIITENIPEINVPYIPNLPDVPVVPEVPAPPTFFDRFVQGLQPVIKVLHIQCQK